jgi:type IV secretory pathway VirJ component
MKKVFLIVLASVYFYGSVSSAPVFSDPKLPIIVLPAAEEANTPMVLMITGDGGWKNFDPRLANQFVQQKAPVVALNALHYFWTKKTPEQTTASVEDLLNKYMQQWNKKSFILVGFSFGADVMPFVFNRLPDSLLKHCKGIALFSPGLSTDFEIHISQMLSEHHQWKYNVVSEMEALKPARLLCFFGDEEHEFPVNIIPKHGWQLIYLKGGHHYEKNTDNIAKIVLDRLGIE